jgi:hypothetical protein
MIFLCGEGEPEMADIIEMPFRDVILKTIQLWKDILKDRAICDGVVYAAEVVENDYCEQDGDDLYYYSSYENAYAGLVAQKQKYLCSEDLKDVKTYGRIQRITLDDSRKWSSNESYLFDTELRLVKVYADNNRLWKEDGSYFQPLNTYDYQVSIPIPFKKGDIVKVERLCCDTYYGVVIADWKKPETNRQISLFTSVDVYIKKYKDFDFTDDTEILEMSYCAADELPEEYRMLNLISEARRGDGLDFYMLLHYFGRDELDRMLDQLYPPKKQEKEG